ncbi:hypothetical protein GCE9029_02851 [Grimontia celer]|uniref:Uncharacterized protein n=2 Tax=Grimontia celer TaxID=1796497 RepID=A0A128F5P2_9GAMM|nr:hypothetical protein GCE9029_02851 [Grimontia celer]
MLFGLSISNLDVLFFICIFGFPLGVFVLFIRIVLSRFDLVKVDYNARRLLTELLVLMALGSVLVVLLFFVVFALSQ